MNQYFPKPYSHLGGNVTVELDLFNYIAKSDAKKNKKNKIKKITGVD